MLVLFSLMIAIISTADAGYICNTDPDNPLVIVYQRIFPAVGPTYLNLYDLGMLAPDCTNLGDRYWKIWTYTEWNNTVWNETYNGNESMFLKDLKVKTDYRKFKDGIYV